MVCPYTEYCTVIVIICTPTYSDVLIVTYKWLRRNKDYYYYYYYFTESQAASYKHFQCQNRCLSSLSHSFHNSTVVLFWQRPNLAALATACRTIRILHFFQWNSPVFFKAACTPDRCCSVSRGLQRDVVYLGPLVYEPKRGEGGVAVSQPQSTYFY